MRLHSLFLVECCELCTTARQTSNGNVAYLEKGLFAFSRFGDGGLSRCFLILLGLFALLPISLSLPLRGVVEQIAEHVEKEQNASAIQVREEWLRRK